MLAHGGCQVTWLVLVVSFLVAVHHCLTPHPPTFLESVVVQFPMLLVLVHAWEALVTCGVVHVHSCTSTECS